MAYTPNGYNPEAILPQLIELAKRDVPRRTIARQLNLTIGQVSGMIHRAKLKGLILYQGTQSVSERSRPKWTAEEVETLKHMMLQHASYKSIASLLNRPEDGVKRKATELRQGKTFPVLPRQNHFQRTYVAQKVVMNGTADSDRPRRVRTRMPFVPILPRHRVSNSELEGRKIPMRAPGITTCQFFEKFDPPLTDEDKCGKKAEAGAYCLEHYLRCFQKTARPSKDNYQTRADYRRKP